MSKIDLPDIASQFASQASLNARFTQIETEFNTKVLYRDNPVGEPNSMSNDLDMNNNSLFNTKAISTKTLSINGQDITAISAAVSTLPDQAGNAGKFLSTDGAAASWNILSGEIVVLVANLVVDATLVIGNVVDTDGYTSKGDGGDNSYEVVAGGTGTNNGFTFIDLNNGLQLKALFPKGITNVMQAGAIGDGVADDTLAIQTAINNTSLEVKLLPGTYRTTSTISTIFSGVKLVGDGNRFGITINGDHVLGPVIRVGHSQCVIKDFIINASVTRNAAAVTTDNHGLQIGSTASNFVSNGLYEGIIITRQPSDGFHFGGEGVGTIFTQCSAQFNRGHGFFTDDGTTLGDLTPERNGGVKLLNCRSQENGGNGFNGSQANGTNYRYVLENVECFDNAWNTAIPSLVDAQFLIGGQAIRAVSNALGDPSFANTVMTNGDARLAKGAAGNGIFVRGPGSDHIDIINNRFIDLGENVVTGDNITGLNIDNNFNSPLQALGFRIGTGCLGLRVIDPVGNYTTTLISESGGGELRELNFISEIYPSSSLGIHFLKNKSLPVTIVAGVLNCLSSIVDVKGESDLVDSITNLRFSGSLVIQDGWTIKVVNRNTYNITMNHATGNIFNNSGANVILNQDEAIEYTVIGSNAYQI